jgi:hypothetical protein
MEQSTYSADLLENLVSAALKAEAALLGCRAKLLHSCISHRLAVHLLLLRLRVAGRLLWVTSRLARIARLGIARLWVARLGVPRLGWVLMA